jgi:hypothetical protein
MNLEHSTYTVLAGFERVLHSGPDLAAAVAAAHDAQRAGATGVCVFDDATGDRTEVDSEGRCGWLESARAAAEEAKRGPGRPKLGVVSREVSLLPRHWEWLASQPMGASAAIRRLVDEARASHRLRDRAREATDAAYKLMSLVGGDRPGFEEAARALYAGRVDDAVALTAAWPGELAAHVARLLRAAGAAQIEARAEGAPTGEIRG